MRLMSDDGVLVSHAQYGQTFKEPPPCNGRIPDAYGVVHKNSTTSQLVIGEVEFIDDLGRSDVLDQLKDLKKWSEAQDPPALLYLGVIGKPDTLARATKFTVPELDGWTIKEV